MGIRKLIYVPSEEVWDDIKATAKRVDRSASNYLIQLHLDSLGDTEDISRVIPEEVKEKVLSIEKGNLPPKTERPGAKSGGHDAHRIGKQRIGK